MARFAAAFRLLIASLLFSLTGAAIAQMPHVNAQSLGHDGVISLSSELLGPKSAVEVAISDVDLNKNPSLAEAYSSNSSLVTVTTSRQVGPVSPDIRETGQNTGVFTFRLQLTTNSGCPTSPILGAVSGSQPSIGVCVGDIISIRYDDKQNAAGNRVTVTSTIEIKSWDASIKVDKSSYDVNDSVNLFISDIDANRDSTAMDIYPNVRVTSDSDQIGIVLKEVRETSLNTGVFMGTFKLSSSPQSGALFVSNGDTVRVMVTDEFSANGKPQDFVLTFTAGNAPPSVILTTDRQSYRTNDEIIITGTVSRIQKAVTTNTVAITNVGLVDISGNKVKYIAPNQQVIVSATISNNDAVQQPFVALIEINDSQGITKYVQWSSGILTPQGQTSVGLSWTPQVFDHYQIKAFVIDSLDYMQPLSKIGTYNVASREFSTIDTGQGSQPLIIRIQRTDGAVILVDQVRVEPDRSFMYTASLGGLASASGTFQGTAAYDHAVRSTSFAFFALSENGFGGTTDTGRKLNFEISTNSTLSDVILDQKEAKLAFTIEGTPGTSGVVYVRLPVYLLGNVHRVTMDGVEHKFTDLSTPLNTIIKIEYTHSRHRVELEGERWYESSLGGGYSVFYKPNPCAQGYSSGICYANMTQWVNLQLYFMKPDDVTATNIEYLARFGGNSRQLSGSIMDGAPVMASIPFNDLFPYPSEPFPKGYSATIEAEMIDGRVINNFADVNYAVVPEFPVKAPLIIITIFITLGIAITRARLKQSQP